MRKEAGKRDKWMTAIASLKLVKGLLLLVVAIGALRFLHADIAAELKRWIHRLNVDAASRIFQKLLAKVSGWDEHQVTVLSIGTFLYSALFLTEGVGLFLQKRWAEYLTVIATASFLPLEVYELIKKFDAFKLLLLLANAGIVVYLIWRIKCRKKNPAPSR